MQIAGCLGTCFQHAVPLNSANPRNLVLGYQRVASVFFMQCWCPTVCSTLQHFFGLQSGVLRFWVSFTGSGEGNVEARSSSMLTSPTHSSLYSTWRNQGVNLRSVCDPNELLIVKEVHFQPFLNTTWWFDRTAPFSNQLLYHKIRGRRMNPTANVPRAGLKIVSLVWKQTWSNRQWYLYVSIMVGGYHFRGRLQVYIYIVW